MTATTPRNPALRRIRGIRGGIAGGYMIGRIGMGRGPPQLIPIQDQANRVLGTAVVSSGRNPPPIDTTGFVKYAVTGQFTVGYTAAAFNFGTKSSGTFTPSPASGNLQYGVNAGAHTLAAPTASGSYTIVLFYTNNGTAGAITAAGFTSFDGDAFSTVDTKKFFVYITKINSVIHGIVKAF